MPVTTALRSLITPDDARYDEARAAFNVAVDQRPAGVVIATTVDEVIEAVTYARENGLRVAPQTTGHNAGAIATLEDTILVKKPRSRRRGGCRAADRPRRRRHAVAGRDGRDRGHRPGRLHGSSPDVGVVGYSLGGGIGWLARKHGLQTNSITAIELVTADGELVRADAEHNADLFWALRGGGGNYGVVTAIEFELYPVEQVYAGWLIFPWERSAEVLKTWNELLPTLPDEMTSIGESSSSRHAGDPGAVARRADRGDRGRVPGHRGGRRGAAEAAA